MIRFTTCIIILSIISPLIIAEDPCSFQISGGLIDLSSVGHTDGTPAFPDKIPAGASWKYSYNPCRPFSEGSECQNVAACQVSLDGQFQYGLGSQESAHWDAGSPGNNPTIGYSLGSKTVQVELVCSTDFPGNLDAVGEGPPEFYKFRLTSKCCCPNGCQGPAPTTTAAPGGGGGNSLSPGSYFIIILAALAVVYLIVFISYNRFRHHSGLDLIPHRTFWVAVPVYAKDGVVFLVRKVTRRGGGYQST